MTTQSTFIKGAAILAVAGVIVRFVGAPMRILLAAIIGDEGIGLFQMAYPIYSSLLAISTAGIPVAISKLVAENLAFKDYREAMRVFRIALLILSLTGLAISLLLIFGANFVAVTVARDARAVYALQAIAPAIFFVTVMSAIRGFFQGQQQMVPTALSQLLEQAGRVAVSLILAVLLLPVGLEFAAAGAASGAVAGGILGLGLLLVLYWRSRKSYQRLIESQASHNPAGYGKIVSRIFSLAIPITFGSLILPLITLIDLAVVPRRLQEIGLPVERATQLYGQLTGMAGSVVYFPNVVALALSMSLVPAVSEAFALRSTTLIKSRSAIAIKLTALFCIPAAVGLYLLATPITVLLFRNAEAGYSLAYMAWSVIPLCLYVTTTGVMQGLGRPIVPVLNMVYGGAVKTVLAWYLTALPALNIGGAALATVVGIGVAAVLNLYHVARHTGWRFRLGELVLKPGLAVTIMAVSVSLSYRLLLRLGLPMLPESLANGAAVIAAITAGLCVYGAALLLLGSLSREELALVPWVGGRLVRLAERFRLLK